MASRKDTKPYPFDLYVFLSRTILAFAKDLYFL